MSMYKFTNSHTLFSYVVKRGIVTNNEACKKKSVTKSTVKKSSSRNSHGYGTHKGVKEFKRCVNTHDSGKLCCHDFNIDLKHRATHSKHIQGVHNVFHENRFAVLTDENVHSDVDSDCNDSIFVELNGGNVCSTSKGVNVNTVSQNAHKGKNAPYLEIRQPDQKPVVHPFKNKTGKITNMTKQAKVHELRCLAL